MSRGWAVPMGISRQASQTGSLLLSSAFSWTGNPQLTCRRSSPSRSGLGAYHHLAVALPLSSQPSVLATVSHPPHLWEALYHHKRFASTLATFSAIASHREFPQHTMIFPTRAPLPFLPLAWIAALLCPPHSRRGGPGV